MEKSFMPISNGNTLYVGGTGEDNYTKIQDAIDNATDGDTVFVYDESSPYYENIEVDKSINLIGEDKDTTVIDGNYSSDSIYIGANYVNIKGFTIINGIYYVLVLWESTGCSITGNKISTNNHVDGIFLMESSGNNITDNNITLNNDYGIFLDYSNNNTITGNNILNNDYGIFLKGSSGNNITGNNILNNDYGIFLMESSGNNIIDNNILNNDYGISLLDSNSNIITGNNILNNDYGISLLDSNSNIITGNKILNNDDGILLSVSNSNTIQKNNFLYNKRNAHFENCKNTWRQNFWNRPRILPKLIFGMILDLSIPFMSPWFNIDWHPAKEPYDI